MKIEKICLYTREISRLFRHDFMSTVTNVVAVGKTFFVQPRHTHTHIWKKKQHFVQIIFLRKKKKEEGGKREHETLLSNFHQCLALAGPWAAAEEVTRNLFCSKTTTKKGTF